MFKYIRFSILASIGILAFFALWEAGLRKEAARTVESQGLRVSDAR